MAAAVVYDGPVDFVSTLIFLSVFDVFEVRGLHQSSNLQLLGIMFRYRFLLQVV